MSDRASSILGFLDKIVDLVYSVINLLAVNDTVLADHFMLYLLNSENGCMVFVVYFKHLL